MGTPDFAIPSLLALIEGSYDVIAVITQPDRPKGRHGVLTPPPVKLLALQHNIPVHQPAKVKDKEFVATLREMRPDVIVVVAYGQIVSKEILDIPSKYVGRAFDVQRSKEDFKAGPIPPSPIPGGKGETTLKWCINIHASLLPKYRGSAPINWALINGEKVTGVTSMIVTEGLDSGPILLKKEIPIDEDDDARTLHDKLSEVGGKLLLDTMNGIISGTLTPIPQDESEATYFPMLKKSDGLIDWARNASEIRNRIRGLIPWPGAYTYIESRGGVTPPVQESEAKNMLKIYKADVVPSFPLSLRERVGMRVSEGQPGAVVEMSESGILVTAGKDCLMINELQIEGKRRMTAAEFIRGHKIEKGMVLGS